MAKLRDLVGQKFNRLTVLKRDETRQDKVFWICLCECGQLRSVLASALATSNTKSCGCIQAVPDLTSQRFGSWFVHHYIGVTSRNRHKYWVVCDCGVEKVVHRRELVTGKSRSCGCKVRLPDGEAARNALFLSYQRAGRRRNYTWKLSLELFMVLTKQECHYCGAPPALTMKTGTGSAYLYNGIDRVNNSLGYEEGNVVTCCRTCNQAKNVLSEAEFLAWIRRIYLNFAWEEPEEYCTGEHYIKDEDGWIPVHKTITYAQ